MSVCEWQCALNDWRESCISGTNFRRLRLFLEVRILLLKHYANSIHLDMTFVYAQPYRPTMHSFLSSFTPFTDFNQRQRTFVMIVRVIGVCPPNFNPADFYIHQLAIVPGREIECRQFVQVSSSIQSSMFVFLQCHPGRHQVFASRSPKCLGLSMKLGSGISPVWALCSLWFSLASLVTRFYLVTLFRWAPANVMPLNALWKRFAYAWVLVRSSSIPHKIYRNCTNSTGAVSQCGRSGTGTHRMRIAIGYHHFLFVVPSIYKSLSFPSDQQVLVLVLGPQTPRKLLRTPHFAILQTGCYVWSRP